MAVHDRHAHVQEHKVGLGGQGQVHGFSLRLEPVAVHHLRDQPIVEVDIGAAHIAHHTPTVL